MLKVEYILLLVEDFVKVYVEVYDIVLNGYELGGGFIWIYIWEF